MIKVRLKCKVNKTRLTDKDKTFKTGDTIKIEIAFILKKKLFNKNRIKFVSYVKLKQR